MRRLQAATYLDKILSSYKGYHSERHAIVYTPSLRALVLSVGWLGRKAGHKIAPNLFFKKLICKGALIRIADFSAETMEARVSVII